MKVRSWLWMVLACAAWAHVPAAAQQVPGAQERFQLWRQQRGSEPIMAGLSFGRTVSDADVRQFLQRHNLRPTAIYMASAGMVGVHRVAPERASAASVAEARQHSIEMTRRSRAADRVRAQRHVAREDSIRAGSVRPANRGPDARALAAAFDQNEALSRSVGAGEPIIFAVEVMGSVDAVEAAARDPMIVASEPAYVTGTRVTVPRVRPPAVLAPRTTAPGTSLPSAADAAARIRRAAGQNR